MTKRYEQLITDIDLPIEIKIPVKGVGKPIVSFAVKAPLSEIDGTTQYDFKKASLMFGGATLSKESLDVHGLDAKEILRVLESRTATNDTEEAILENAYIYKDNVPQKVFALDVTGGAAKKAAPKADKPPVEKKSEPEVAVESKPKVAPKPAKASSSEPLK